VRAAFGDLHWLPTFDNDFVKTSTSPKFRHRARARSGLLISQQYDAPEYYVVYPHRASYCLDSCQLLP
jgi:hypothetical protein